MRVAKDEAERKALANIKKHGLHIMHVFGDEKNSPFSYSVGLFENYLHPEIIIIGLKYELAQVLLNNMAFEIKNGKNFTVGRIPRRRFGRFSLLLRRSSEKRISRICRLGNLVLRR